MPYRAKPSAKELARRHTKRAIFRLSKLMDDAESEAVQRQAAVDILDRGWGKPSQEVELTGSLTVEQMITAAAEKRKNGESPSEG